MNTQNWCQQFVCIYSGERLTLSSVAATGKIICMLGSWNPPRLARLQTHEAEITRLSRAPLSIIEARRRRSNSIRLLPSLCRISSTVCGAFDTRLALRNKVKKNCPLFVLLLLQTEKSQTFGGPAIIRHNHYSGVCMYRNQSFVQLLTAVSADVYDVLCLLCFMASYTKWNKH